MLARAREEGGWEGNGREGDKSGREESLELPVVGTVGLVGHRERGGIIDGTGDDGCKQEQIEKGDRVSPSLEEVG